MSVRADAVQISSKMFPTCSPAASVTLPVIVFSRFPQACKFPRTSPSGTAMAEIIFEQASKRYPDGFEAVKSLDLTVADGEFLVLVGPSGCGKSTALRMVAGLEDITRGAIKIGGRTVNALAPRERNIAMVFQS